MTDPPEPPLIRLPDRIDHQPSSTVSWRTFLICIVLVTALGGVLRFLNLGSSSAWIDEIYTIRDVPIAVAGEHHLSKTIGYLPTAIGLKLGGVDIRALDQSPERWREQGVTMLKARWPNALLGVLTIPVVGLLFARSVGRRPALLAAVMLAASPWHLWMSQLARFYAMQFLFVTISLGLYLIWVRERRVRDLVLSMIALAAAFFTQPPAILLGAAFAVAWLVERIRRDEGTRPIATLVGGLITAGVCAAALGFDVSRRPEQWVKFAGDQPSQGPMTILLALPWLAIPSVTLAAGTAMILMVRGLPRLGVVLIAAALAPTAIGVLAAFEGSLHVRYLFAVLCPTVVLAALAMDAWMRAARSRGMGFIGVAMLPVVIMIPSLVATVEYLGPGRTYRAPFKEAFELVQARAAPGELVFGDVDGVRIGTFYLGQAVTPLRDAPSLLEGSSGWFVTHVASPSWGRGVAPRPPVPGAFLVSIIENRVFQPHHAVAVWRAPQSDPAMTDEESAG